MYPPSILLSGSPDGCPNYCRAVAEAGGLPCPIWCPNGEDAAPDRWDGLILTGGSDLIPSYYGQHWDGSRPVDPARDEAELTLIPSFFQRGKPILAICRGFQLVNVVLGGNLRQAMEEPFLSHHDQYRQQDRFHNTTLSTGSFLHRLYGDSAVVNSAHHQAVTELGSGLIPCQWAEDGIVEGFYHAEKPVFGVQWHPERCTPDASPEKNAANGQRLFSFFLAQCGYS